VRSQAKGGSVWTARHLFATTQDDTVDGASAFDSVTIDAAPSPSKLVFIGSELVDGNLGGVSGADSLCQDLASAAGHSGSFKAWISDDTSSPYARFTRSTLPYELVDGTLIADDWSDLTDGAIDHAINIDEYGAGSISTFAYTFTMTDGRAGLFGSASSSCYGLDCHCSNWSTTRTSGPPYEGSAVAQSSATNGRWTDYSFVNACGGPYRIYCFEQ